MIRLSKSCLGNAEKQTVLKVLDKEYLGMGDNVAEFEEQLSNFFNHPTVCVSTGTAGLHLALQSIGLGIGDEVLVQSLTYVASFQAISATGAIPIACDIDSDTLTINITDAKSKLTKNTKAIMPVHYAGGVGNLYEVYQFAEDNNLRVIEDAAHAFGTIYKDKKIGSFGDIVCFSFDGIKNITSGEGGCVVTNDKKVLQNIQDSRLLGVEKDTENRFLNKRSWNFDVTNQGWRYHMSNIMAAIGVEQLRKFNEFAKKRQRLAQHYQNTLNKYSKIKLLALNYQQVVPHIFVIQVKNRDKVREYLANKDVQTGIHFLPNHYLTFFRKNNITSLVNTDAIYPRLLTLPLHPDLTIENIDYVCKCLLEALVE